MLLMFLKMLKNNIKCSKYVDVYGDIRLCPRLAKWLVFGRPVCGLHATSEIAKQIRIPIKLKKES